MLERLKGDVVVLFFWSVHMLRGCRTGTGTAVRQYRGKGVEIVAVNGGETRVPTVCILDRGGIVRKKFLGAFQRQRWAN